MTTTTPDAAGSSNKVVVILAWLVVGLPLLWGVAQTMGKAALLFR
jgi:hypothetical protein